LRLLGLAAAPLGGLNPAEDPLIEAETYPNNRSHLILLYADESEALAHAYLAHA
jgi:hypothetical protein